MKNKDQKPTIIQDVIFNAFQSSEVSKKYNKTIIAVKITDETEIIILFVNLSSIVIIIPHDKLFLCCEILHKQFLVLHFRQYIH